MTATALVSTGPVSPEPSNAERAAIDSLVAALPAAARHRVLEVVQQPGTVLQLNDAAAQRWLNVIYTLRASRTAQVVPPRIVPATLVRVKRLTDSSAAAIIIRRTSFVPHDVIVLDERAGEAELGAAVNGLFALRDKYGDVPSRDARLVVKGSRLPAMMRRSVQARGTSDLERLNRSAPQDIPGIGRVRSIEVPLVGIAPQ